MTHKDAPLQPVVCVVDDDSEVRTAVCQLLSSVAVAVEEFESATDFLAAHDPSRSGCLVIDLLMPGMTGLELQQELIERRSTLPIVLMTGHADVETAVKAVKAGAFDFIEKPVPPQRLLEIVQNALLEDSARRQKHGRSSEIRNQIAALSQREKDVMQLLIDGQSTKQVALSLGIGLSTVDHHRKNVLRKMKVDSLVLLARRVERLTDFSIENPD